MSAATDTETAEATPAVPQVADPEYAGHRLPEIGSETELPQWISIPTVIVSAVLSLWGVALVLPGNLAASLPAPPLGLGGMDLLGVAVVIGLGVFGVQEARETRRIREMEEHFPDFLHDLAAHRRAGFPLSEAVQLAAQGSYGPLSSEIERMAAQLSWNVPFEEAFERFADRVDTPLVDRACTLVLEAELTGGRITDVLEAVAVDVRELNRLANERRTELQAYIVVTYISFLVFLGVVAVLQTQLLPTIFEATGGAEGGQGTLGRLTSQTTSIGDYRTFFYVATLVQAVGNGTMTGLLAYGRFGPGLRHAAIMSLMTVATFVLLL